MQFSAATIIIAFAGFAFAAPAYNVCPGGLLYSSPVCCDTDVLGVAALNCKTVPELPKNAKDYQSICSRAGGKAPKCCSVPILQLGVLCIDPVGI